jgi:hypothetical protein
LRHRVLPLRKAGGDADHDDPRVRVHILEGDVVHAEPAFAREQEALGKKVRRADRREVEFADGVGVIRKQERGHGQVGL